MSIEFKSGDRVEYPDVMKFQLGAQRTNQQGTVVDVVRGENGRLLMVVSEPDEPFHVIIDGGSLRIDYVDTESQGAQPIRKLDE